MGGIGFIGTISVSIALLLLALLSKRLGKATQAAPYYAGFYLAAAMVAAGALARVLAIGGSAALVADTVQDTGWVLLYNGLPAAGVTLGVVVAWRYWSWLLAERD